MPGKIFAQLDDLTYAIKYYQEGRMEELKKYCLDDVRITRDIYEYGLRHGKIYFISNRDYQKHEVPVQWGRAANEMKAQKKSENAFPTSLF